MTVFARKKPVVIECMKWTGENSVAVKDFCGDSEVKICPHIDMKAADGSYVVGWLASQTDMLADDWGVAP